MSLDEFSHAYGLLLLVQGVSNLVGPPFAGYLFDVTRQWYLTFSLAGAFIAASGLILLVPPFLKRIRRDQRRRPRRRRASQIQGKSLSFINVDCIVKALRLLPPVILSFPSPT